MAFYTTAPVAALPSLPFTLYPFILPEFNQYKTMSNPVFHTIGLIGKFGDPHFSGTLSQIADHLRQRQLRVLIDESSARQISDNGLEVVSRTIMGQQCDLVIVLGGGNTEMFGDLIERTFLTADDWNVGSALSLIMMVLILLIMLVQRGLPAILIDSGVLAG